MENALDQSFCGKFIWLWTIFLINFFCGKFLWSIILPKMFLVFLFPENSCLWKSCLVKRKFLWSNFLLKLCLIKHFVGNFFIKYFVENFLDQRKFLWLWNNPLSREFPWLWKNYFLDCKNNRSETILKQLRHEFWF